MIDAWSPLVLPGQSGLVGRNATQDLIRLSVLAPPQDSERGAVDGRQLQTPWSGASSCADIDVNDVGQGGQCEL